MRRRRGAEAGSARSAPSKTMRPREGGYSPTIIRATVDFPQPDSPTNPRVSPLRIENETPSTARKLRRGSPSITRLSQGRETSKSRPAFSTRNRLSSARSVIQPACSEVAAGRKRRGTLLGAAGEALGAARIEGAAGRDRVQARHRAVDLRQPLAPLPQLGDRAHQPSGIRSEEHTSELQSRQYLV